LGLQSAKRLEGNPFNGTTKNVTDEEVKKLGDEAVECHGKKDYARVKVRGGQSDLLLFSKNGKFLYETKIWRGPDYYKQGLRELEEYVIGEGDDPELKGIFYVVFDPTKSASAQEHIGSFMSTTMIAGREVNVIVVNLAPPQPSKKS
jgi:hypothetical protein